MSKDVSEIQEGRLDFRDVNFETSYLGNDYVKNIGRKYFENVITRAIRICNKK